ncbi:MAG: hypothetical protein RMI34_08250 [Chloroherpetonaceae bacterium]|nr:hypothetical protein [Chloroherpetonaceae bacterium]MDW8020049.1 hypothetical protein [Chloroherpetonaceae bacterium]
MRICIGIFLLLVSSVAQCLAQGGSLYSRFGIGEVRSLVTAQSAGMGFAGSAIPDLFYIHRINPAMLTTIDQTRIAGDFGYIGYFASSPRASGYQVVAGFEGASLAIPIWQFVVSTGILPYSRLNYRQTQRGTTVIGLDTLSYSFSYFGLGGLNSVPIAVGFTPLRSEKLGIFRVGAALNFLFGTTTQGSEHRFDVLELVDSAIEFEDRLAMQTWTFGLGYTSKQGIFAQSDLFSLSVAFSSRASAEGTRRTILTNNLGNSQTQRRDTLNEVSGWVSLPSVLTIGLAYSGTPNYIVAADVMLQDWSAAEYFGQRAELQRRAVRFSLGAEVIPSLEVRTNLFSRIAYRIGAYYYQTNWQIGNTGIDEWGLTAGLGIPLSAESSRLDISLQYARRGTTTNGLIEESIFRFGAALNIGERWFLQRKIE